MKKSTAIPLPWPYWTYYLITVIRMMSTFSIHLWISRLAQYDYGFSTSRIVLVLGSGIWVFYGLLKLETGLIPFVFTFGWTSRVPPTNMHRFILGYLFLGFGGSLLFPPYSSNLYWLTGIGAILSGSGLWLFVTSRRRTVNPPNIVDFNRTLPRTGTCFNFCEY